MKTSETITNLAAALAEMQNEIGLVGKSGENKFDRYSYATLEDYIKNTKAVLAKHGFFIATSNEAVESLQDRVTKNGGTEHAVRIKLNVRLIHKSGEWLEINCSGEGQDRADKAIYKAITGARKYAIASLLGLATSDDPEADEDVGLTAAPKQKTSTNSVDVDNKVADWIAKIDEQTTLADLKGAFDAAIEALKPIASPAQINKVIRAKDDRKTMLGLYAQGGVKAA